MKPWVLTESHYPSPHKAPEDSSVTLSEQAKTPTQAIQDHPQRHPPQLMSATWIREHAGPWTMQYRKRRSSLEQKQLSTSPRPHSWLTGTPRPSHYAALYQRKGCPLTTFWYRPSSPTPAKSTLRTGLRYSYLYASDLTGR